MDFDYNAVKYLVIILSLLILGYVIFLIYTDLSTVRGEFNKLKSKIFETSDSLTELQKQIEYVSADAVSDDTEIDPEEHTLHEILNNKFFTSSQDHDTELEEIDPELGDKENSLDAPIQASSFSFNIPFFSEDLKEENKITEIKEEPSPYEDPEEIQFVSSSNNKCEGILASGKNKGKQCNKDTIEDTKFCSKHTKST